MKFNRRRFLQGSAVTATALAAANKIPAMEVELGNHSYNYIKRAPRQRVFSCSPLTPHDNPVEAWVENDPLAEPNPLSGQRGPQVVEISGVTESNRSRGRVNAAEASAWLQLTDGDRLSTPLQRVGKRGSGRWQPISWEAALQQIGKVMAGSRPQAIALLRGKDTSAGVWQRFLHTFGSNTLVDLDGNANRTAAWQSVWGSAPAIPDLAESGYILNFGSNFFVSRPDYAADAIDGKRFHRARLVTFDPRCSKTAGLSSEWVAVRPGSDGAIALAMTRYLLDIGLADTAAIERLSNLTAERLKQELQPYTLEFAEQVSGAPALAIRRIAHEFADSGRGSVITGAGISRHSNGYDTERAIMLLSLVTGMIEVHGGSCVPRQLELGAIEPVPPAVTGANPVQDPCRFPIEAGKRYPVDILFGYNTNPAFEAPAAALWRSTLADQKRIGFFVAIGSYRNETFDLADLILPETHWLERNEPVSGQGSLLPWVGIRQRVVPPPSDRIRELREILRDIVNASGTDDDSRRRYWQFQDTQEWLGMQLDGVAGLKKAGGWKLMAAHSGVWPIYGYLHPVMRRIVDEQGEEVHARYGMPVTLRFADVPQWQPPADSTVTKGELTLLVHDSDYRAGDGAANNKIMAEILLANHLHIHTGAAQQLGIRDGDLVRVASATGYLVTHARVTEAIHPAVVGMHRDGGHWGVGGIAAGRAGPEHPQAAANIDRDIAHNLWWEDPGVHPMDLIAPVFDPHGGAAFATPVRVTRAKAGDRYGMVKIDMQALRAQAPGRTDETAG